MADEGGQPVSLFVTCVVDVAQPEVGVAVVQVLRRLGHRVEVPDGQTCCGQPAWNSGFVREAAAVAGASLDALDEADGEVVVPAGSCATMIRLYWPQLFALAGDDARAARAEALAGRVHELTEFLAGRLRGVPSASPGTPVAYHHSCHMTRELHLHDEPLEVLAAAGRAVAPWPDADRCCGFGGTFSVKLPEVSVAMADEKLATLPEVDEIVGADTSCLLHLAARARHGGSPVRVRHVAEVLAESMQAAP